MTATWEFVLCDALVKVHPVRDPRPVSGETRFQAFLGEPASFQLAYRPPLDPGFRDPSPLRVRVEGDAADLVAVSSADLVPCTFVALPGHDDGYEFDEPGLYPDVLRPVPDGEARVRFGSWSALWFDVITTDAARAGVHELTIVMNAPDGSELHREQVSVEITGIELPPLDIVSSHWMHLDALADHYGVEVFSEEHWTLVERFMASAVEMGATSLLAPVWTPPLDTAVGT
ncbi:MAG TPA: glycoside hydrolase domain-containing protein, partial [Kribbella sp.]|nr:glycoside hydrolase domain-containing protein [Kribbella sp.]